MRVTGLVRAQELEGVTLSDKWPTPRSDHHGGGGIKLKPSQQIGTIYRCRGAAQQVRGQLVQYPQARHEPGTPDTQTEFCSTMCQGRVISLASVRWARPHRIEEFGLHPMAESHWAGDQIEIVGSD